MINLSHINSSWLEIDKKKFINNLKNYKIILNEQKLGLVVKGNAYGHGILEIAQIACEYNLVDKILTGSTSEALFLRQNNIIKPILVLATIDSDLIDIVNNSIKVTIYNLQQAIDLNNIAKKLNKCATVHLKIDTGMSRLGLEQKSYIESIKQILNLKNLHLEGIFTHICDNTNPDPSFNYNQLEIFNKNIKELSLNKIYFKFIHAVSSSGIYLETTNNYNLARIGAGAYGLFRSEFTKNRILQEFPNLKIESIAQWKSKIIHINNIEAGRNVGYGRTYTAKTNSKIAIVPVGYYDGYPREFSNNSYVLINGQIAPVVGIISMNLLNIDITNISNSNINDTVTILGENIDYIKLSEKVNIIPNDLFSGINPLIKRYIK